jgi:hypothetical protein
LATKTVASELAQLSKALKTIRADRAKTQDRYDKETDHSKKEQAQKRWHDALEAGNFPEPPKKKPK